MKEKIPTPENLDLLIDQFLDKLAEYSDLYEEVRPEIQEQWYWVEMRAMVGKDRETAKTKLEEFLKTIEGEVERKRKEKEYLEKEKEQKEYLEGQVRKRKEREE